MRPLCFGLFLTMLLAVPASAQKEAALTLGSFSGPSRTTTSRAVLSLSNAAAIQGSYGKLVRTYKYAELYGEINAMFAPKHSVTSTAKAATNNISALYITPGIRLKFYPKEKLSPWVVGGLGYALYRASSTTIAGGVNPSSGSSGTGAFEFGGGLDFRVTPKMSLRFEVRDFFTGSPRYNYPIFGKGQYNFLAGGGVIFHLGAK